MRMFTFWITVYFQKSLAEYSFNQISRYNRNRKDLSGRLWAGPDYPLCRLYHRRRPPSPGAPTGPPINCQIFTTLFRRLNVVQCM